MRPRTLRSQLISLVVVGQILFASTAGAAWLAWRQDLFSPVEAPWLLAAALITVIGLSCLLAATFAERLSGSLRTVESSTKALASGAAVEPASTGTSEIDVLSRKLAQAASVARAREASLRSADRAKDEFIAMLGHELRNPLSALAAASHVLRRVAPDQPVVAKSTEIVARQVQHMTRLVEDLLDVNRIARGKVALSRRAIDLAPAVRKAVAELRAAGRLQRHEVRLDLAQVWVRGDEARIEQIVVNLIGNAAKYTPAGGSIGVTLRRDRDAAVLRVRDTGIGMSPELCARVFDLFVQGEGPGRRGGLGIGLTLVRQLAELHGGKAFAASGGAAQGSVFTVTLPAIEAPGEEPAPMVIPSPQARHRILLVEDNDDTRDTLFAALQLDGHRVYEAADGTSGLRTAEALKPDVALIDISLPGLSGFDVAAALRDKPERERMVLIAMTGFEKPDSLRRAREAGFDEYVTKPIAPDDLVRVIDAAFVARCRRTAASARP